MHRLFAAILLGALAGCMTSTPRSAPPGVCSTERTSPIQGNAYTDELRQRAQDLSGATLVRVMRPGQVITKEYRDDRLNIQLDASDVVVRVYCG